LERKRLEAEIRGLGVDIWRGKTAMNDS
jgi:hypothetical protein